MVDLLADLDPAAYVRPPVLDVASGLALGRALLAVADPTMPAAVARAVDRLQTALLVLEHQEAERSIGTPDESVEDASTDESDDAPTDESDDAPTDESDDADDASKAEPLQTTDDARIADLRLDRAWVAVGRRLEVLVDLPPTLPQTEIARVLHRQLFPDGLAFLNLPFRQQWAHSEERLRLVEDEDLGPQLAPLVGGFVLDELWAAHEEYGRVLGIEDPAAGLAAPARLVEGLRELRDAIAIYALQLLAVAHDDPERADAVRAALRPIQDARRGPFDEMTPPSHYAPDEPDGTPPAEPPSTSEIETEPKPDA